MKQTKISHPPKIWVIFKSEIANFTIWISHIGFTCWNQPNHLQKKQKTEALHLFKDTKMVPLSVTVTFLYLCCMVALLM